MANVTGFTKDRCTDHQDRETLPPLCAICQRINVERQIVERAVDALLAAGFALHVHGAAPMTRDRAEILDQLRNTDDDYLVARGDNRNRWVRFVYGNDGYDVICDYTTNLEEVLTPVLEFARTFEV